jgi:tripartite-type tricarboxylate transporter receptor subunit TctC
MLSRFLRGAAAVAAGAAFAASALAADYPVKPVTLIVPFPPGGVTDNLSRAIAKKMSDHLGQPIVIENRPGAGGSIAAEQAVRAAPDGYTLFVGTQGTHGTNLALYKTLRYDPLKDFVAIHSLVGSINVLVVSKNAPYGNVQELVAYAKAHPGELAYASAGVGTGTHLTAELFQQSAGIKMAHIPYKGAAPALNDLLGGQVNVMFDYPNTAGPFIQDGKLRALAVTYGQRLKPLPNVPTMAEAGVKNAEAVNWGGIFVPARTPPEIVARLIKDATAAMNDPEIQELIQKSGGISLGLAGKNFQDFVNVESAKWRDVVKRAGITAE